MNIIANYNIFTIREIYKVKPIEKIEKEQDLTKKYTFKYNIEGKIIDIIA